jgi:hypothetical protein
LAVLAFPVVTDRSVDAFRYPTGSYSGAGVATVAGLSITASASGQTVRTSGTTLGSRGYVASDFAPTLPRNAPSSLFTTSGTGCLRVRRVRTGAP